MLGCYVTGSLDDLQVLPHCHEAVALLRVDRDFLLIDKPVRLLSVPGRHPLNRDSVISRLQADYPNAAMVHRLDFDTSGVMVVPLGKAALSHISRQFQARSLEKTYTAVVQGLMADDEGVIDLPIAPDVENRPRYKICHKTGKPSLTEYKVLMRDVEAGTSRVQLHPITGRSHQLRLHLWALGHPILGCGFYGIGDSHQAAPRLLLHATTLRFLHPRTGEAVEAQAPVPF